MKRMFVVAAVVFLSLLSPAESRGDSRYYAWTYQFVTMPPGESELEFYNTLTQPDLNSPGAAAWKRQVEIEAGLTERWDISLYITDSFKTGSVPAAGIVFSELKFRTRYKLVPEKNKYFIDPLIYLEYKFQADRTYPGKWEARIVLAKDIGDLNLSLNIIPEESYRSGTKNKYWKTEYAFGASYPVAGDILRIGAEAKGDLTGNKHSAGPVISIEGKNIWLALSPIFGINTAADDLNVQAVIGLVF